MRFIASNIQEIEHDRVLRWYGAALASLNVVTAINWLVIQPIGKILDPATQPVCWPFFPSCYTVRVIPGPYITDVVIVLLLLSVCNAGQFVAGSAKGAYALLCFVSLIKTVLISGDFRLTLNHHYMAYWVTVPFLLVPEKRRVLPVLIVAMYFWAGILKILPGSEWLTGAGFFGRRPLGLPASWIPLECAYVVALELGVVFGLLSRRPSIFWASFAQVILFHISSFWVVGFFYPAVMFCILAIFPLAQLNNLKPEPLTWRLGGAWATLIVLLFSACQLLRFTMPGDSSITGEGRLFALNMFDAPIECHAHFGYHDRLAGGVRDTLVRPPFVNSRTYCDPIVYLETARDYCRGSNGGELDLYLESRRMGDAAFRPTIDVHNVCQSHLQYSMFHHNSWIMLSQTVR